MNNGLRWNAHPTCRRRQARATTMEAHEDLRPELNADRRRRFGATGRTLALLCECGKADCRRAVLLTPAEYEKRRAHYVRAGKGTPPPGATPLPPDEESGS